MTHRMTSNPAYISLYDNSVKRSFPVSSTTFCEPDPSSKDSEDDHLYDTIPAVLPDHNMHKSADGFSLVDDSAVKIDSVPQ